MTGMGDLDQLSTKAVLVLERSIRSAGTGITAADLIGRWCPQRLWSPGAVEPSAGQAQLLRWLRAELSIAAADQQAEAEFELSNAIALGALTLRFTGPGWLQGRRPLLFFRFERLTLTLGRMRLLTVALPLPELKRSPFFALIASSSDGWLLARGRGGGLALWKRD